MKFYRNVIGNTVNWFHKRWILSESSRTLRNFAPDFNILVSSKGVIRFRNGAYSTVSEYFVPDRNAAVRQKMMVMKAILEVIV